MRKTLNINLGGLAFIIDENAFELLHNYLEALKRKFNNEAERAEIMNDIEGRIAELLNQKLENRKEVIGIEDVQFVTDAMGKPEDIAGEETAEASTTGAQATPTSTNTTSAIPVNNKRLFRDPDDAKIGGVISGICHFFGIEDPTWARVAALILIFFTSGVIIPVYILLLLIIPKAQTAAEKLQMKGEPVNINTIEKEIKEAAGRAGESVHNFVKEQNIFERLWDAFKAVFVALAKVLAVFAILLCMLLLVVVAGCFIAFYVTGSTQYNEATHILVDSGTTIRFLSFGFLLFLATPLVAFIYLGLKVLLGQRSRVRWLKWALVGGWVIGIVLLLTSALQILTNFKTTGSKNTETVLQQPARGALFVQLTDSTGKKLSKNSWDHYMGPKFDNFDMSHGSITVNGTDFNDMNRITIGRPSFQLIASENDSFYIQKLIYSQGKDKNDAVKNADMVIYSFSQADTVLNLPGTFYINKSDKWRAQRIWLRIAIPKGKRLSFADNIDLWGATVKGDANYDDTFFANTTWTVEDGAVKCIVGENHKNAEADGAKTDNTQLKKKLKKLEDKLDKLDQLDEKDHDKKDGKDEDDF